jgi:phenylalanyl-tRNA synthetase alpha subunit
MDKWFCRRSRSETIQEACRKFHERELAKEEKRARVEIKALEKRNQKEARQIERAHRSSATQSKRSKPDLTVQEKGENPGGYHYYNSALKKTYNAWTKLIMWLRTRFMRMGKKRD